MSNLYLHCGGEYASRDDVNRIVTPDPTERRRPLAHGAFVDMVQDELENAGFRVTDEAYGLARNGGNLFGLFTVARDTAVRDYAPVVGFRNSHLKMTSADVAFGSSVFVCDNMAFIGDFMARRRHTTNMFDEEKGFRPRLVEAISRLVIANEKQDERFDDYKSKQLDNGKAEVFILDAFRRGAIGERHIGKVVQQWDTPDHEEFAAHKNVWRMFNAVTESLKETSPLELPKRTAELHRLADDVCEVTPLDMLIKEAA